MDLSLFDLLMWSGVFLTMTGVLGLVMVAHYTWKLRQTDLEDTEMRAALHKSVARNNAALFVSVLGLMLVIIGLVLR
jgi:hypothetical protein